MPLLEKDFIYDSSKKSFRRQYMQLLFLNIMEEMALFALIWRDNDVSKCHLQICCNAFVMLLSVDCEFGTVLF